MKQKRRQFHSREAKGLCCVFFALVSSCVPLASVFVTCALFAFSPLQVMSVINNNSGR